MLEFQPELGFARQLAYQPTKRMAGRRTRRETHFPGKTQKSFATLSKKLQKEKIFPGFELGQFYPELKNHFLVCATETKTPQDLDRFVEVLAKC